LFSYDFIVLGLNDLLPIGPSRILFVADRGTTSRLVQGRIKSEAALCRPQGWMLLFCRQKGSTDGLGKGIRNGKYERNGSHGKNNGNTW
tara:strand:+ start:99 stop:365 length:267 start_codon:yes stop_codon:yes gene_type:complete